MTPDRHREGAGLIEPPGRQAPGDGPPLLAGRRLTLRPLTADDAGQCFTLWARRESIAGQGIPGPASLEVVRERLTRSTSGPWQQRATLAWSIALADAPGRLIGDVNFHDWDRAWRSAEIGYDLDPAFWGRGIMTEALTAMLTFGFERLDLNRVQAIVMVRNTASLRVVERLGFVREGVLREHGTDEHGAVIDDVVLSLLRRDWTAGA